MIKIPEPTFLQDLNQSTMANTRGGVIYLGVDQDSKKEFHSFSVQNLIDYTVHDNPVPIIS